MNRIIFVLLFTFPSIFTFGQKSETKFKVTYNKNIETFWLASLLADEVRPSRNNKKYDGYPKWRKELKEKHSLFQPVAHQFIIDYYDKLKSNKIAKLTAELTDVLLDYDMGEDVLMTPLLTQKEFPTNDYNTAYEFENDGLDKGKVAYINSLIKNYIKELGEFYKSEHLWKLFRRYDRFYQGAIGEIKKNVPSNSFEAIEKFYGEQNLSYTVYVSPMFVWLIENNQGRGLGNAVITPEGRKPYEIMSPYLQVSANKNINDYTEFGYDYEPQAQALTVHEFSHSFVNKEVDKFTDRINKSDTLFSKSKLSNADIMPPQGIHNWKIYVIESLVRVGEIKVALMQNDIARANRLRNDNVLKNKFVLIPLLEEKLKLYENNRIKYPKYADFLPELLTVFENVTLESINKEIGK
jgi:hypothetical protein